MLYFFKNPKDIQFFAIQVPHIDIYYAAKITLPATHVKTEIPLKETRSRDPSIIPPALNSAS